MRCLNCSKVNKQSLKNRMCWKEWQLCGDCARIIHSKKYPKNHLSYIANKMKKNVPAKNLAKGHGVCPICKKEIKKDWDIDHNDCVIPVYRCDCAYFVKESRTLYTVRN